jgi:hypothetical protein
MKPQPASTSRNNNAMDGRTSGDGEESLAALPVDGVGDSVRSDHPYDYYRDNEDYDDKDNGCNNDDHDDDHDHDNGGGSCRLSLALS